MDIGGISSHLSATPMQSPGVKSTGPEPDPADSYTLEGPPDPLSKSPRNVTFISLREATKNVLSSREECEKMYLDQKLIWSHETITTTPCDPAYDSAGGILYTLVGKPDHNNANCATRHLTAFNSDGSVRWSYADEEAISSPVIDKNGNVYARFPECLRAFDRNGRELWSCGLEGFPRPYPPVTGKDGTVYILADYRDPTGGQEYNIQDLAIENGKKKWNYPASAYYCCEPQILEGKDGAIYLAANRRDQRSDQKKSSTPYEEKSFIFALDPHTGSRKLSIPVGRWTMGDKSCLSQGPDGTLFACHNHSRLTAYTPEGREKWTFQIKDPSTRKCIPGVRVGKAPSFDDEGNMYLTSRDASGVNKTGYLLRLDARGKELWRVTINGGEPSTGAHLTPDGQLFVGSKDGRLLGFDMEGRARLHVRLGKVKSDNLVSGRDGELFVHRADKILAINPQKNIEYPSHSRDSANDNDASRLEIDEDFVSIDGLRLERRVLK